MRRLSAFLLMVPLLSAGAVPAAAQSQTTTQELLAGVVTEEVAPGVLQVVNDGFRNLTVVGPSSDTVDIGPGGEVWVSTGPTTLYRLGDGASFPAMDLWPDHLETGPDGTLWATGEVIWSFDGEAWTARSEPTGPGLVLGALAIGPDGTVWVAARDLDKHCGDTESVDCAGTVLMRLEDDGSLTTIDDWSDVYEGDAASDELAVSPDGEVWLIAIADRDLGEPDGLLRFDGSAWTSVLGPECLANSLVGHSMVFGPDGTLWVHTDCRGLGRIGESESYLARFDGSGWTALGASDGVHDWGLPGIIFDTDLLTAAPDGSLWMNDAGGGVAHFDGGTWTSYLQPYIVDDIAIAPDGSVWAWVALEEVAWEDSSWQVGLFVITPEAVAAVEPVAVEAVGADEAAATAPNLLPGVDLVTEEVEPGDYRIVNDGVRDLTPVPALYFVFGEDGRVWGVQKNGVFDSAANSWSRAPGPPRVSSSPETGPCGSASMPTTVSGGRSRSHRPVSASSGP